MTTDFYQEAEIKVRIAGKEKFRRLIRTHGFRSILPRHGERNLLFDFPGQMLQKSGILLRLRQGAGKAILTLKRPAKEQNPHYKIREELEIEVDDFDRMQVVLSGIGLEIIFIYEKFRQVFARADVRLMLDETSIGDFVEVEAPPPMIDRVCEEFGFSRSDYLTDSYRQLFFANGGSGNMLFSK